MEGVPQNPEEKPKLTPEERHIMYQRGGVTSGFVRREEARKDKKGQYIFSEDAIERARLEMEGERVNELKIKAIENFSPGENYPERQREIVAEKEKEPWFWNSFKERVKGFFTFGWWEVHQAEKFRSAKKKTGKEIKSTSSSVYALSNLSLEDAYEEAYRIQASFAAEGKPGGKGAESKDYERLSGAISAEKKARNQQYAEYVVSDARKNLEDKLKKYKDASGKQIIFDKNRIGNTCDELRRKLLSLENGAVEMDAKDFTKIIKENLDPKYWKRYVYAGVEAALWFAGWWVWTKSGLFGAETAKAATSENVPMDKHIWGTVKHYLSQHGIANPTDKQIMEGAKIIAKDNGIGVKIWGIPGSPLDTHMAQGYLLKFGGLAKKLALIKSLI